MTLIHYLKSSQESAEGTQSSLHRLAQGVNHVDMKWGSSIRSTLDSILQDTESPPYRSCTPPTASMFISIIRSEMAGDSFNISNRIPLSGTPIPCPTYNVRFKTLLLPLEKPSLPSTLTCDTVRFVGCERLDKFAPAKLVAQVDGEMSSEKVQG